MISLLLCCFVFSQKILAQTLPPCPAAPPSPFNSHWSADDCRDACVSCNFQNIDGSTNGFTPDEVSNFCPNGTIENNQWYAFIATAPNITIQGLGTSCSDGNGIQLAVYEECGQLPIACDIGCTGCANSPVSVTFAAVVGKTYLLMVDGFAGDVCDFSLQILPPNGAVAQPLSPPQAIQGQSVVCPGGTFTYSIPAVFGASTYIWDAPANWLINGQIPPVAVEAPFGNSVEMTAGKPPSTGSICVLATNSCFSTSKICKPVAVQGLMPTVPPPITVCFEDFPIFDPNCQLDGLTLKCIFTSWLGCDSVVHQPLIVKPPIIKTNPPKFICAGESIEVLGEQIDQPGPYQVVGQSWQGCDSTVTGQLVVFDPVAEIETFASSFCLGDSLLTLNSAPSQGFKIWKNEQGDTLATGAQLSVNQSGKYILQIKMTGGTAVCTASDTIEIGNQNYDFQLAVVAENLTCKSPTASVELSSSPTAAAQFWWTGPAGFKSNLKNLEVSVAGLYQVTAADSNGCSATQTVAVLENKTPPPATPASTVMLSCGVPTVFVQAAPPPANSNFSYSWSGPYFSNHMSSSLLIDSCGNYLLITTDLDNGCSRGTSISVVCDFAPPIFSIVGDSVLNCIHPTINPQAVSPQSGVTFEWIPLSAGDYSVVATGANGCTSSKTLTIEVDFQQPQVQILGNTILTCDEPTTTLTPVSPTPNVTFAWQTMGWPQNGSVIVDTAGKYTVVATGANGCTSTAAVEVVDSCLVSSHELDGFSQKLKIYPNVATSEVFLETAADPGFSAVAVFDAAGKFLFSENFGGEKLTRVDVRHLPEGIYFLKIKIGNCWLARRLSVLK